MPVNWCLSFICDGLHRPPVATYPLPWDVQPFIPVGPWAAYLVYQPVRFTMPRHHWPSGELLPPLFTLTDARGLGGIFSVALAVARRLPTKPLPVRKYGALCCPDFPLLHYCSNSDKPEQQSIKGKGREINTERWGEC